MAGSSVGGGIAAVTFSSSENVAVAARAASTILAGVQSGAFTPVVYSAASGGAVAAPGTGRGLAVFEAPTAQPVTIPTSFGAIVVNADGPVSLIGGGAGGTVLAGAGSPGAALNLTYTDITGSAGVTTTVVVTDGNNLLQTSASEAGSYAIATGSGNDTISVLAGNSTISAGSGANHVALGPGASLVNSTGFDTITGASSGGGTDTVNVTTGTTSIASGTSSFLVNDSSPNAVQVRLGSGADTVNVSAGGPATIRGQSAVATTGANATVAGVAGAGGDFLLLGNGASTVVAGSANDTVQALSGTNMIQAGTGNDTLLAGAGADTLMGGSGGAAGAQLVSGTGLGTTFAFVAGQSGGADTISGLKASDLVTFTGYGRDPQGTAVTIGGNTVVTLGDGTTVTIVGSPTANQFVTR